MFIIELQQKHLIHGHKYLKCVLTEFHSRKNKKLKLQFRHISTTLKPGETNEILVIHLCIMFYNQVIRRRRRDEEQEDYL